MFVTWGTCAHIDSIYTTYKNIHDDNILRTRTCQKKKHPWQGSRARKMYIMKKEINIFFKGLRILNTPVFYF